METKKYRIVEINGMFHIEVLQKKGLFKKKVVESWHRVDVFGNRLYTIFLRNGQDISNRNKSLGPLSSLNQAVEQIKFFLTGYNHKNIYQAETIEEWNRISKNQK